MGIREYVGKEATVRYEAARCIHAGECTRGHHRRSIVTPARGSGRTAHRSSTW